MAKRTVNKSQAIRDYVAAHPEAMPKEVVAALKEDGIKVSPGFVSTTKFSMRKSGKVQKRAGSASKSTNGDISLSALTDTAALVNKLGGVERAKALLDVMSGLH